jgi:hypothetical protein
MTRAEPVAKRLDGHREREVLGDHLAEDDVEEGDED